jgi:hypothetical protein
MAQTPEFKRISEFLIWILFRCDAMKVFEILSAIVNSSEGATRGILSHSND